MRFKVATILALVLLILTYIILDDILWHTLTPDQQQDLTISNLPPLANDRTEQTIKPPKYLHIEPIQFLIPNVNKISFYRLHQKWQYLFFHIFIKQQLIPTLQSNNLYSNPIKKLLSQYTFSIENATSSYSKLLYTTQTFLNEHKNNTQFLVQNHHILISIRRMLMLIHKEAIHEARKTIHSETKYTLSIFMEIHKFYLSIISQPEYRQNGYNIFYNIHISKAAGTTICDTMADVGKKRVFRANCNIPRMGTPIKTPIYSARTCEEIDSIADKMRLEFIAQESPMSGHGVSLHPTLCPKYRYILPIREPITRIASLLTFWNGDHYWPFQILVNLRKSPSFGKEKLETGCKARFVHRGNDIYGTPSESWDYNDFISKLFENEGKPKGIDGDDIDVIKHDNFACHTKSALSGWFDSKLKLKDMLKNVNISKIGSRSPAIADEYYFTKDEEIKSNNSYKKDDLTYIQWLDDDRKYAIKTTTGFRDRVNRDLIRGYCSNIYTRFIGFEHKDLESVYDSLYANSKELGMNDWFNAVEFMMMTDYVLPFDRSFKHKIWNVLLRDITNEMDVNMSKRSRNLMERKNDIFARVRKNMNKDEKEEETNALGWKWSQGKKVYIRRIPPSEVLGIWKNKREKQILEDKNTLDNVLYKLAGFIADVDVLFYKLD